MIRRPLLMTALATAAGCGLLLPSIADSSATAEDAGGDVQTTDAPPPDATPPEAAPVDDASVTAPFSCEGQEAGTRCEVDGAVCFSDATCAACLGSVTDTCRASGECCNGRCVAFDDSTIGTCAGNCAALGESCKNTACCLPYTCSSTGADGVCVQ